MSTPRFSVSRRFWRVWQRNRDVYFATWLINLAPQALDPFLYVLAFGFGLGALVGEVTESGRSLSYLRFVAPGMLSVAVMFHAYFEGTYGSYVRMYYQKTFAAQMATPLSVEDVIVGEIAWAATKSLLSAVLMVGILGGFGLLAFPEALWILPFSLVGGVLFGCLGLVITAVAPNIDFFNVPYFLLVSPMFLFSGTFFPLESLPGWARGLALALPLTHVTEVIRAASLSRPVGMPLFTAGYLAVSTILLAGGALLLMRRRLVP